MNDEIIKYLLGRVIELEKQVAHSECPCVVEERKDNERSEKQKACDHVYPEPKPGVPGGSLLGGLTYNICTKCGQMKPFTFDINQTTDRTIYNPLVRQPVCDHEYENPWFGITSPSCKKCGYNPTNNYTIYC